VSFFNVDEGFLRGHIGKCSLLSFAKFLELLIYSTHLISITPSLCEHATPPPRPWSKLDTPLPRSRLNIIRHFSINGLTVSISLRPVDDIYEVRVPRLQVQRIGKTGEIEETSQSQKMIEADRRALRREIMQFWQVLSEHIDTLENNFIDDQFSSYHKSLPRLPSASHDVYDTFDDDGLLTPKALPSQLPLPPPNSPNSPKTPESATSNRSYPFPSVPARPSFPRSITSTSQALSTPTPSAISSASSEQGSLTSLTNLRHKFQRTEQDLYVELSRTPDSNLNDVRRAFESAARGATNRLSAWEVKHTGGQPTAPDALAQKEPEWWQSGCHAVPGGNIIVREDDWGSIIAFTLRLAMFS
jgi:1-phosphatidylinositol-3-phosphate 5-kinase